MSINMSGHKEKVMITKSKQMHHYKGSDVQDIES